MTKKAQRRATPPEAIRAFARAQTEHQAGQLAEAQQLYHRALAIDPDHADSLHYLGVLSHQSGDSERALALIGQALSSDDGNAEAHHNIGLVLGSLGRTDEAIGHYQRAVAIKPDYADAHTNLAAELLTKGDSAAAVLHFRRALARNPNLPESYGNLAGALIANGHPDEALGVIGRGLEIRATPQFKELLVDCLKVLNAAPKSGDLRHFLSRASAVACARSALLDLAATPDAAEPPQAGLEFCCALAQQSLGNHTPSAEETAQLATLREQTAAALQSGAAIPALTLVALAAFGALASIPGSSALLERKWQDAVTRLLAQQPA